MRLTETQLSTRTQEEVKAGVVVVLDTSTLLSDPECLHAFGDAEVVLPMTVVEELDKHKSRKDDVGLASRTAARMLEELRVRGGGEDFSKPVDLPNGGRLNIVVDGQDGRNEALRAAGLDTTKDDNKILAVALALQAKNPEVQLVSADVNLRVKASALGLQAKEYLVARPGVHDAKHPGWKEVHASDELIDDLYARREINEEDWSEYDRSELSVLGANEFGILRSGKKSALVRRTRTGVKTLKSGLKPWGLEARSKEQGFALDLLMDKDTSVVAMSGQAGTGKSMLAIAAALEQVIERKEYDRVMILRPVVAVGNQDIGFLPGTVEEKLGPWMEAITDAVVALGDKISYADAKSMIEGWALEGRLTMEAVTYLRGRSLQRTFIIVDEAQNLESLTLKTILTRLGQGSKVVFTGDVTQIDNPFTSERSNALSVLADRFRGQSVFGHLVLTRGERSEVATLAAELL